MSSSPKLGTSQAGLKPSLRVFGRAPTLARRARRDHRVHGHIRTPQVRSPQGPAVRSRMGSARRPAADALRTPIPDVDHAQHRGIARLKAAESASGAFAAHPKATAANFFRGPFPKEISGLCAVQQKRTKKLENGR